MERPWMGHKQQTEGWLLWRRNFDKATQDYIQWLQQGLGVWQPMWRALRKKEKAQQRDSNSWTEQRATSVYWCRRGLHCTLGAQENETGKVHTECTIWTCSEMFSPWVFLSTESHEQQDVEHARWSHRRPEGVAERGAGAPLCWWNLRLSHSRKIPACYFTLDFGLLASKR